MTTVNTVGDLTGLASAERLDRPLAVRVRLPGQARAQLATPDGHQTTKRVRAAMFWTRAEAEKAAALCREFCPAGTVVKIGPL